MLTIETHTPQNVVLQYELAELKDRTLSFFLDQIILFVFVFICLMLITWIFIETGLESIWELLNSGVSNELADIATYGLNLIHIILGIMIVIYLLYPLVMEMIFNGQTLGKMIMKIKTVRVDGKPLRGSDLAIKWSFRALGLFLMFYNILNLFQQKELWLMLLGMASVTLLSFISSSRNQTLGDAAGNTIVIKLKPELAFNISTILEIHKKKDYTPKFPKAVDLDEETAVLIKTTLERKKKHNNKAHNEALSMLALKIKKKLNADKVSNPEIFLKTVLNDYVFLTR